MKRALITGVLVLVLIVVIIGGYMLVRNGSALSGIEKDSGSGISDYSAVFLSNGQVYFGTIHGRTDKELDLRDIYYLQVNQQIQPNQTNEPNGSSTTDNKNPNVVLVKLGSELHGPNDRMRINTSQILFTESLKDNSKVVEAIKKYVAK
jgi:hypothetical protein